MRFLILICLLALPALAQDSEYTALLQRAQKADSQLDFTALRRASTRVPGYNGYSTPAELDPMLKALGLSQWDTAEKQAHAVLEKAYLQMDAHYVLLLISKRKGDKVAERQHDYMLRGLSNAIRNKRDGSSPEEAWNALNVTEEFSVCRLAGWRLQSQDLVRRDSRAFDRVMVVNGEGKSFAIYFDISDWFGKL